jgi:adenosylcobyric acid synthase
MARALMFMGTGSDVGKSLIVAGLCRAFASRGIRVVPFKPQNMSNNAAVTADGGEIGRAQALQARAARREPLTAMNPVLLKPEAETGAQLIVRGKRIGSFSARDYWQMRGTLLPEVDFAFRQLAADADLVLVEGAGSASEVNLRPTDIANFGFARAVNVPVVLIGDIDRGGVIAALVGTFAVIEQADAALIRATLVNKFRGDPALFADGMRTVRELTELPCLGPVPFFPDAARLPAEDSLALEHRSRKSGAYTIAVPHLPRIANFDDLDPLIAEPNVSVLIVEPGTPIPQSADLVIIPGSKATRADLVALRQAGWDIDILAHRRAGKPVFGICGGYQMLGKFVADPDGIEGVAGTTRGLGLLEVETTMRAEKELESTVATHTITGAPITAYRMHMGETTGPDRARPFAKIGATTDGATSPDGLVAGTYLHGLFASDAFRRAFLGALADPLVGYEAGIESTLDALAAHLETYLDLDHLLALSAEV